MLLTMSCICIIGDVVIGLCATGARSSCHKTVLGTSILCCSMELIIYMYNLANLNICKRNFAMSDGESARADRTKRPATADLAEP